MLEKRIKTLRLSYQREEYSKVYGLSIAINMTYRRYASLIEESNDPYDSYTQAEEEIEKRLVHFPFFIRAFGGNKAALRLRSILMNHTGYQTLCKQEAEFQETYGEQRLARIDKDLKELWRNNTNNPPVLRL